MLHNVIKEHDSFTGPTTRLFQRACAQRALKEEVTVCRHASFKIKDEAEL